LKIPTAGQRWGLDGIVADEESAGGGFLKPARRRRSVICRSRGADE